MPTIYLRDRLLSAYGELVGPNVLAMLRRLAAPLADLRVTAGNPISFVVDLIAKRQSTERAPAEGEIMLTVPSPDFEAIMWQA